MLTGIGLHINQESIEHPDVANPQHTTFIMGPLVASVLQVLPVIGAVEINPAPLTPTNEFIGNKQGKST